MENPTPTISAIIPARNEEASIARAVESVAVQAEIAEVIVVDDESTDRTPEILGELRIRIPKLKIVQAGALPAGWTGKNHAVSVGSERASGDWLLFTDADTYHMPGSARKALADVDVHDSVLVSYSPEQEMGSFWERALIPLVYWRLSQRYSFDRVNDPHASDAAANGQFLMIRRDAYLDVGGHAAIASEILEDVALARRVKQAGHRIFFASGQGIVQTRMYRSFHAMWEGWTKNLYPLFGGTLGEMALELEGALPWLTPALLLVAGAEWYMRGSADWLVLLLAIVFLVRPWAAYEGWLRRNRYPAAYIQYYLPGVCLYAAVLIASWWKNTRGTVAWKGREYSRISGQS